MSSPSPTQTIEDYLATLFVMERDGDPVAPGRLAKLMGVAPPTVTVTLQRMQRDGWLSPDTLALTEAGRSAAQAVVRRHMLVEWMLSKFLKVPLGRLHIEAHRMEHAISPETEMDLAQQLGHPEQCPHGNPLPGRESTVSQWVPLPAFKPGSRILIRRLHEQAEENSDVLQFLVENGVIPGVRATVTDISKVNETVSLLMGPKSVVLGFATARFVYGEPT